MSLGSIPAVYAQQSKPIRLAPAAKAPATDKVRRTPERRGIDIENPRGSGISSRITGGDVQVDILQEVNANEAGVLTPADGALGLNMWQGTSAALVEQLLIKLPIRAPSAAMRELMRKLLLSPSRVPEGLSDQSDLIAKRLEILITIGALEEADKLFGALPSARSSKLLELEADLRFLANDNARACALAAQEIANKPSNYWHKAFVFCNIIRGDTEKAALSLSLMRELGELDEAFLALAEGLISETPQDVPALHKPSPLHLAISRVGNIELPAEVIAANIPSVLQAIAMSPKASLELRLEAAERADAAGALPVDALRQLYTSVEFSKDDLSNPLSRAEIEFGPMVRALLYRTSLAQKIPIAQAEATARAFALARDEGRYASTVRVFQPVLSAIPASNELLWFAPEAVRALLLSGEQEQARTWYQVLQSGALGNEDAAKAIALFRPLAAMFEFDVIDPQGQSLSDAWWTAVEAQPDAMTKGVLLYTLLEIMGGDVSDKAWELLIDWQPRTQQTIPSAGLINRLQSLTNKISEAPLPAPVLAFIPPEPPFSGLVMDAPLVPPVAETARIGEIVLLSLIAIGDAGPAKTEVGVLATVLRALIAAGLKKDARALALEAALANGL